MCTSAYYRSAHFQSVSEGERAGLAPQGSVGSLVGARLSHCHTVTHACQSPAVAPAAWQGAEAQAFLPFSRGGQRALGAGEIPAKTRLVGRGSKSPQKPRGGHSVSKKGSERPGEDR